MHFKNKILLGALLFPSFVLLLLSCGKDKGVTPVTLETGTMTDIDGNVYPTVKIGNQWWMAENLKTRRYRNGTYMFLSTNVSSREQWDTMTTGACCGYKYDINSPAGYLYNWYAIADTSNIAPIGWHVPTDADWQTLEQELGISASETDKSGWRGTDEAEKLKKTKTGVNDWKEYQTLWCTNESGFTALAGGCHMFNYDPNQSESEWSSPQDFQHVGFWWTASEHSTSEAWYRYLDYKNANVFRSSDTKHYGFSIRCVKD